jgi:hypothetical protein
VSDTPKPVDILFVVPDAKYDTWRRAIKHVLWALESDKTFEVMSADTFVHLYSKMTVQEMDAALKLKSVAMTTTNDISKREWKDFRPLRDRLFAYWQAQPSEEGDGE